MISSPCKNCPRRRLPKEVCAKDCQLLQAVQDRQRTSANSSFLSGIDYTEESRYSISISLTRTSTVFWTI
ncbi:MAG: hypothetical protein JRI75_04095 [Deltaproteobacteria bacterium]|nr:hypothetical protein [Deltaproteobacteria bacterium]